MSEEKSTVDKKQMLKKYAVFTLMFIIFAGSMWLLFAPSDADKEKDRMGLGYNSDIPAPKEEGIISDKKDAYEQEQMKQRQNDKMQSLQDYAFLLGKENKGQDNLMLVDENPTPAKKAKQKKQAAIGNSVSAYKDINRTLGNFYETPKEDNKESLEKRIEELEDRLTEKEHKQQDMDDQVAFMEKSYQLAAKYMPQGQNQGNPFQNGTSGQSAEQVKNQITKNSSKNGKTKVSLVHQVREQTVSALYQQLSDEDLFIQYDQVRNFGFNTLDEDLELNDKNTITVIVHEDQTLIDGQSVRLRLKEPIRVGKTLIPENTIITGLAKLQGERLGIHISSLEYEGEIIPVDMTTYDTDGQKGIYIPGSLEMNALQEIAANASTGMGTSVSVTKNAGSQVAADLSRGLIQGASQYMAKKIRQVKVNLKSGYKIYLLPNDK